MSMLALGVLLGSATSQLAQSAGLSSILLEAAPSSKPVSSPAEPRDGGIDRGAGIGRAGAGSDLEHPVCPGAGRRTRLRSGAEAPQRRRNCRNPKASRRSSTCS